MKYILYGLIGYVFLYKKDLIKETIEPKFRNTDSYNFPKFAKRYDKVILSQR
jgi:hypothetical protein